MATLRVGFYKESCPSAESIIQQIVRQKFLTKRSVTPALLRMHYHDCFIRVTFFFLTFYSLLNSVFQGVRSD